MPYVIIQKKKKEGCDFFPFLIVSRYLKVKKNEIEENFLTIEVFKQRLKF